MLNKPIVAQARLTIGDCDKALSLFGNNGKCLSEEGRLGLHIVHLLRNGHQCFG